MYFRFPKKKPYVISSPSCRSRALERRAARDACFAGGGHRPPLQERSCCEIPRSLSRLSFGGRQCSAALVPCLRLENRSETIADIERVRLKPAHKESLIPGNGRRQGAPTKQCFPATDADWQSGGVPPHSKTRAPVRRERLTKSAPAIEVNPASCNL